MAEKLVDAASRNAMLKIADSYDQLAKNAERRKSFGGKGSGEPA
jgi:hypothetical protein